MGDQHDTQLFDNLDQLLTYEQVSKWFNLSVSTLTKYVHRNEIPRIKFNDGTVRFKVGDLKAWIQSKKIGE